MDIVEVQTVECKLYLFVDIDRTNRFAITQLVNKVDKPTAWKLLEHLLKAVPYQIHTVLTDNGIQFADRPCIETPPGRARRASTRSAKRTTPNTSLTRLS